MHRVVSLGHIDADSSGGIHIDSVVAAVSTKVSAVVAFTQSDELWEALWEATVQLYHGAAHAERARACARRV
jgi:hypothetical protein